MKEIKVGTMKRNEEFTEIGEKYFHLELCVKEGEDNMWVTSNYLPNERTIYVSAMPHMSFIERYEKAFYKTLESWGFALHKEKGATNTRVYVLKSIKSSMSSLAFECYMTKLLEDIASNLD